MVNAVCSLMIGMLFETWQRHSIERTNNFFIKVIQRDDNMKKKKKELSANKEF